MSILDRLDRGNLVKMEWTIVEYDWVKSGLLRLNSNEFNVEELKGFKMPWSWK
jgi:hypothetical protein